MAAISAAGYRGAEPGRTKSVYYYAVKRWRLRNELEPKRDGECVTGEYPEGGCQRGERGGEIQKKAMRWDTIPGCFTVKI